MPIIDITNLPAAPSRQQAPDAFVAAADKHVASLSVMVGQLNQAFDQIEAAETSTSNSAAAAAADKTAAQAARTAAQTSAELAAGYAGAAVWSAVAVYPADAVVYSPSTRLLYRRKAAGSSATDPANDAGNWASVILAVGGNAVWHAGNFNPALKADLAGANFAVLSVGGSAVWHAGNFNPVLKADLAGANFTALSVGGSAVWHSGNYDPSSKVNIGNPVTSGTADHNGDINIRGGLRVLNSAGSGWWAVVDRNGGAPIVTAAVHRSTAYSELGDSNLRLSQGVSSSLLVATAHGYVQFGPQNSSAAHIYTDRPIFAFNKEAWTFLDGSGDGWYGRVGSRNSVSDKSVFVGTYASIAVVGAHNYGLSSWADLYINTSDGLGGGVVRLPSTVLVSGNQVWHYGNFNPSQFTSQKVYLYDGNASLTRGSEYSPRFETPWGWLEMGPKNSSACHLYSDSPAFHFNKSVQSSGCFRGNGGAGLGLGAITLSTGTPSGGSLGDIWVMY